MTNLTDEDIVKMRTKESNTDLDFLINRSQVKPTVSNKLLKGVEIVTIFTMTAPLHMSPGKANSIITNYLPSCVSFPIEHIYRKDYDYNTFTNDAEFIYLKLSRKGFLKPAITESNDGILKLRSRYIADFLKLDKGINVKGDIFGCLNKIRKTFLDYMSNYFNPYNVSDEVRECIFGNSDISSIKEHPCKFNAEITLECILNDYLA